MSQQNESARILIIIERGADWPSWVAACQRNPRGRLVLEQTDDETLEDLARRVARCVEGESFEAAVLACSERCDEGASAARFALGRHVLGAFDAHAGGRLWLALRDRASGRARHQLSQLARELIEDFVLHASVSVQVRFGGMTSSTEQPSSGQPASAA